MSIDRQITTDKRQRQRQRQRLGNLRKKVVNRQQLPAYEVQEVQEVQVVYLYFWQLKLPLAIEATFGN